MGLIRIILGKGGSSWSFLIFVSLLPGKTSGDLQELNRANKQLLEYIKLNLSSMATIHNNNKKISPGVRQYLLYMQICTRKEGEITGIYMDPWAVRSAWLS